MNAKEFNEFMRIAKAAYHQINTLLDRDEDGGDMRFALWEQALDDVTLEDAKAVIEQMLKGKVDTPEFGWSEFPTVVRTHARKRQEAREPHKTTEEPWRGPGGRYERPQVLAELGSLTQQVIKRMNETGEDVEQALQIIEPYQPSEDDQRRVKCLWCLDNSMGMVEVWRPLVVRWFRDNCLELVPAHWQQQVRSYLKKTSPNRSLFIVVACCCERGDVKRDRLPTFEPERMALYRGGNGTRELLAFVREHFTEVGGGVEWEYSNE